MRAILAIAHDTLSLLSRRRLFWMNIWLSVLVVLVVGSMRCAEAGWSLGFGLQAWPSGYLTRGSDWETTLFFGVVRRALQWWVAGAAPLIALFSVASIVPKSLKSGAAALLFVKSRGRAQVLLGRFLGSILYAAIPAILCTTGLFLTLGWRVHVWEPRLFFALPFALFYFSILSAVTMMLGVLTRSSSASLVVTLIFITSVMALQDAASRPPEVETEGEFQGMVRAGSGTLLALQTLAWPLPRTHDLSEGMDRAIGLESPRLFRDLVRRWRIGKVRVGAAAAEVLDAKPDVSTEPVTPLALGEAIMVTTGFTTLCLVAAAIMLKRRDL